MPVYLFKSPKTQEVIEVVQKMTESHVYVDEDGLEWQRIFLNPNMSVDSENDGTEEGFLRYTSNRKGTLGDIWDASREASEKRKQATGHDAVQEKYHEDFSKKRKGKLAPEDKKNQAGGLDITL